VLKQSQEDKCLEASARNSNFRWKQNELLLESEECQISVFQTNTDGEGRRRRLKRTWSLEGQMEHQHPLRTEAGAQRFQESWNLLKDPPLVLFGETRNQLMQVDPALLQHGRLPQSRAGNYPTQMQRTLDLLLRRHLLAVEPLNQSSNRAAQQTRGARSASRAIMTI
jgi:hypothetical protein